MSVTPTKRRSPAADPARTQGATRAAPPMASSRTSPGPISLPAQTSAGSTPAAPPVASPKAPAARSRSTVVAS